MERINLPKHVRTLATLPVADAPVISVPASGAMDLSDVVESTLSSFIEAEEQESHTNVGNLIHQLRTGGLAVVVTEPSWRALQCGQVDVLLLSKEYDPGSGWPCDHCGHVDVESETPDACPNCNTQAFRRFGRRDGGCCHSSCHRNEVPKCNRGIY